MTNTDNLKEIKKNLRIEMKRKRSSLSIERLLVYSSHIFESVVNREEYINADVVLAYVSFSSEVDTHFLIQHALKNGKKVAVPKVFDNNEMRFFYINSLEELKPGAFGILEPEPVSEMIIDNNKKYVILLPGVAFDGDKNRLGYGGGYYDRYLAKYPFIYKIMLAYELEKVEDKLPTNEYDVKSDIIITELNTYK